MLVFDDLVEELQLYRLKDVQKERTEEIKGYLKETAQELATKFRKGPVERTVENLAVDSDGLFYLPAGCGKVVRVFDGIKKYEIVDANLYNQRLAYNDQIPSVQIFEDARGWYGQMLPNATSGNTVNVVYRLRNDGVSIFPDYFKEVIMLGTEKRYRARHALTQEAQAVYNLTKRAYDDAVNDLLYNDNYSDGSELRMLSMGEINADDPSSAVWPYRNDVHWYR